MQDLILYIVKNLVTKPEAVTVDEQRDGGEVNLVLTVDPVDMGLVIGKSGNTIKAIRKLLIVKAMADNVRVNLQLAEPEGGRKIEHQLADEQGEEPKATTPHLSETVTEPLNEKEDNKTSEEIAEEHADEIAEQD